MKPLVPPRLFEIPWQKITHPLPRFLLRLTHRTVERLIGMRLLDAIHAGAAARPDDRLFSDRVLDQIGVTYTFDAAHLDAIPKTGPVIVVANHPFGGIEGIVLMALLKKVRPDVKTMANFMLSLIPEMREDFIFVDPFASRSAVRANIRPIKESLGWLKEGHMLMVFPSGEVSSLDRKVMRVRDPAWSPSIAALVRKSGATVVPMYLPGRNSMLFSVAGLIHPLLRTLMLPRQMCCMGGRTIQVRIGTPLSTKALEAHATDDVQMIRYLRFRSYLLAERESHRSRHHFLLHPPMLPQDPVIAPEPTEVLVRELAALPPRRKLAENGDMQVWYAPATEIPHILQEIGRLREVTFRIVGEGTGNAIDLDDFDPYYYHLFLWNTTRQEIAGCYRLGLADVIIDQHGIKGLYTRTLFKFDERLLASIGPAVEMGRSFVRLEYQKAFTSLLLLWRGIALFIAQNPRYKTLFGPVSITNEYREASRCMMLACLRQTCWDEGLAKMVSPRIPPKPPKQAEWSMPDYAYLLNDLDQVADYVSEIEPDGKDVPVLIKQYAKLGGKLLAFNLDPDFSSVVDGLITVNLTQTPRRILRRYMGAELDAYHAYHGVQPEADTEEG